MVTWNCSGCHGIKGDAALPYVPRLAGLGAAYLEKRIAEFQTAAPPPTDELLHCIVTPHTVQGSASRNNDNATAQMIGMAHAITGEEGKGAAAWYASRKPAPGKSRDLELIEKGNALFANGAPAQHLPACQSCHGTQGEGTGSAPRLAGQNGTYLVSRLARFRAEDRQRPSVMTPIARQLSSDQSRAVAAYLQSR